MVLSVTVTARHHQKAYNEAVRGLITQGAGTREAGATVLPGWRLATQCWDRPDREKEG